MPNEILEEVGPLSPSQPLTLVHFGGARTSTRGLFRRLSQSESQLAGAFSESAFNVYVPTPADDTEVQYVVVNPGEAGEAIYRKHDAERVIGWPGVRDTTRYELAETPPDTVLPPITGDASAVNWTFDVPPATGATA